MPSLSQIFIVNRTARSAGAVGKNAIVPKVVEALSFFRSKAKILDFGSGPKAIHTKALRKKGLDVTAHEIGSNRDPNIHDRNALRRKYDIVFASNVLNVQPDQEMLMWTIDKMRKAVRANGALVANLPKTPRKMDITKDMIMKELKRYFKLVGVDKMNGSFVFIAYN